MALAVHEGLLNPCLQSLICWGMKHQPEPRHRERHLRALALLPLLWAAGCGGGTPVPRGIRHVLLVSLDTTRADHLGCYGSDRGLTPRIDALAREAVRFEHVLAPAPTTLASHTSMMTGLYPRRHGVPRNGFVIDEANVMLAEVLRTAGFHTAAVLGSFALERHFDFDQGFAWFDQEFDVMFSLEEGTDQNQRLAENVTAAVLRHVDEVSGTPEGQRMFLFAHYFDPHSPFAPPEPFAGRYAAEGAPRISLGKDLDLATREQQRALIGEMPGHRAVLTQGLMRPLLDRVPEGPFPRSRYMADLYAAEVAYLDSQVGALLDGLEERGLLEETLVVITGDHGETFWEHGDFWNHGLWLFDTTVRIPWILRFPEASGEEGIEGAGRVLPGPVSTVDLLPTLCELLELEPPAPLDGVSLVPALEGREQLRGPVFSEATQPWAERVEQPDLAWPGDLKPRAVRDGRWKYIHAPYLAPRAGGYEQLFDLESDPGERVNLLQAPSGRAGVEETRTRLRGLLDEHAAMPLMRSVRKTDAQQREIFERLRQLGYVGEQDD